MYIAAILYGTQFVAQFCLGTVILFSSFANIKFIDNLGRQRSRKQSTSAPASISQQIASETKTLSTAAWASAPQSLPQTKPGSKPSVDRTRCSSTPPSFFHPSGFR